MTDGRELPEVAADAAGNLEVGQDGFTAISQTGEPYITFSLDAPDDGSVTDQDLGTALLHELWDYQRSVKDAAAIYWRVRPSIGTYDGRRKIRCRVLISSIKPKPIVVRQSHRISAEGGVIST